MIKFRFNYDKFLALMYLLCEKVPALDMLKAVKMLYLIDRTHLLNHGTPILSDFYIRMEMGPVPSKAYDKLKEIRAGIFTDTGIQVDSHGTKYGLFRSERKADLDMFSGDEIGTIEEVITGYGKLSGLELKDITHMHQAWLRAPQNGRIDYELFFADDPESHKAAFDAMMLDQEDRDFIDDI